MRRIQNKYSFNTKQFRKPSSDEARFPIDIKIVGPSDPVPFNLTVFKGGKSWQLPREFVKFMLLHPIAKKFIGIHPCDFV